MMNKLALITGSLDNPGGKSDNIDEFYFELTPQNNIDADYAD